MLVPLSLRSTSALRFTELIPNGNEMPPLAQRRNAAFGASALLGAIVPTMVPKSLMPDGIIKPGPRLGILTARPKNENVQEAWVCDCATESIAERTNNARPMQNVNGRNGRGIDIRNS